jgi:hydroxymethylbilane synthase
VGDEASRYAASQLGDRAATIELLAERAATAALGATCDTPVGVLGRASGDRLELHGYAGAPDGSDWVRDSVDGDGDDAVELGRLLAERMLGAGAGEILGLGA